VLARWLEQSEALSGAKSRNFLLVSADRAFRFTLDLLWLIEFFVFVISYYGELRVLIRALHQQYR
jgi:hypothetical protein